MIIDTHLHPTNLVDEAWRHTGEPFTGERTLKMKDGPFYINGKPRRVDMGYAHGDACVWLDGYPIPILPPSGVMQVAAYECLSAEVLANP